MEKAFGRIKNIIYDLGSKMPFNGDKEDTNSENVLPRQKEQPSTRSSPRKASQPGIAGRGQNEHRTGNPRGAQKIIPGSIIPQNSLHASRHDVQKSRKSTGLSSKPGRGNGALLYTGEKAYRGVHRHDAQGKRSGAYGYSRSDPVTSDTQTSMIASPLRSDVGDDEIIRETGKSLKRNVKSQQGHGLLSPLHFARAEHNDDEIESSPPALPGRRLRYKNDDETQSEEMWGLPSSTDPSRTTFTSRKGEHNISGTDFVRTPTKKNKVISKSENNINLRAAWRGRLHVSELKDLLIRRDKNDELSVHAPGGQISEFRIKYENIGDVRYTDEETYKDYVHIKLANRETGYDQNIILQFRALSELDTNLERRDAALFLTWMRMASQNVQRTSAKFFDNRFEEIKSYNFRKEVDLGEVAPSSISELIKKPTDRPHITTKPKPRPQDNRPRQRRDIAASPNDGVLMTTEVALEKEAAVAPLVTGGTPTRRSTRSNLNQANPSKPDLIFHPSQNWAESLRYPFKKKGPCDTLDSQSLKMLDPDEYLNDEVINFHLTIIRERLLNDDKDLASKVHLFNTYLYAAFNSTGDQGKHYNYEKVKRWTKDVDIFEKDFVFIPINENFHWYLVVVCNLPAALARARARVEPSNEPVDLEPSSEPKSVSKKGARNAIPLDKCAVVVLDSMNGHHNPTLRGVKNYLISEAKHKKDIEMKLEDFTSLAPRRIPGQDNFSDCGVFLLHYIETWLGNPAQIREALYERDFSSEVETRKLWRVSEVVNKRDRMWRLYVRLKEEHEKFLSGQPYTQFPVIDDDSAKNLEEQGIMQVGSSSSQDYDSIRDTATKCISIPKIENDPAYKPLPSPTKRKPESDGVGGESPPSKRAKSITPDCKSPVLESREPPDRTPALEKVVTSDLSSNRRTRASGETIIHDLSDEVEVVDTGNYSRGDIIETPKYRRSPSPDLPFQEEMEMVHGLGTPSNTTPMAIDETPKIEKPLVAANGLADLSPAENFFEQIVKLRNPLPSTDKVIAFSDESEKNNVPEHIPLDLEKYRYREPIASNLPSSAGHLELDDYVSNANSVPTRSQAMDSLSTETGTEVPPAIAHDEIIDSTQGEDTPMSEAPPYRGRNTTFEDIDDDGDEIAAGTGKLPQDMKYKSHHELPNDQIDDGPPSSQDHSEVKLPGKRRGNTVNDPIVIESQSSPKRQKTSSSSRS